MPKIGEMIESKFLKKEDVGDGALLTIRNVKQYNVAMQGAEQEMKWCAEFDEGDKPLVLNSTNLHLIEAALASDNTDDWIGKQIVVYADANISFGGKLVGGIRVDVNRTKKYHAKHNGGAAPAPVAPKIGGKFDDFADDIPF